MEQGSKKIDESLNVKELINLWSHLDSTHMEKEKLLYPASFLLVSAVFVIWDKFDNIIPLICIAITSILMHIYLILVGRKYTSYQDEIFNQIYHLQSGGNQKDITNQFRRIFIPEEQNYGEALPKNLKTGIPSIRELRLISLSILIFIWLAILISSGMPLHSMPEPTKPSAKLPQQFQKAPPAPSAKTAHPSETPSAAVCPLPRARPSTLPHPSPSACDRSRRPLSSSGHPPASA